MTDRPMHHVLVLALVTLAMNGCGGSRDRDAFLEHVYAQLSGDYQRLASNGESTSESVHAFCAAPGPDSLAVARERFAELALTFARVEWLRLGPVVEDFRYERLFYWPDRGGRGRRQLVQLLASDEVTDIDAVELAEKSVALQGLPALEYLLFGDALSTDQSLEPDHCRLAVLIAEHIATTSGALEGDWQAAGDLRVALAGPDEGSVSRDRALTIVLQSAGEALEIAADQKIEPAAGAAPQSARPGLAPLVLSGLTVPSMAATVAALTELFAGPFQTMLPEESRYSGEALLYELAQMTLHLDVLKGTNSWSAVLDDATHHRRVIYLRQPMLAAKLHLDRSLSPALGLVPGFNSLDGD